MELSTKCPEKVHVDYKMAGRAIKENDIPSIEEYSTLQKAFQDIQDLLEKDGVKCVALHGKKGVGKTTIMQHLNNHHFFDKRVEKAFDMVIFIKVPAEEETKDLHILQKIADRINVDRGGDENEVAGKIQTALEDKRYLLLLDGLRYVADGIWRMLDISNSKKDSKVVITTHDDHLVWKSDCVQREVKLRELSPNEAWKMFQGIVGKKNDVPKIARLVCERFCSCVPILIHRIASSFKSETSVLQWRMALDECTPWPQVGIEGLEELSSRLEICYQRLGNPSRQNYFLYASLYPANSNIYTDYLVECCIAQGFVDANTTKYSVMRSLGINEVLKHLVNVSFLEKGKQMRYVKMNDLYQQLASYIISKDSNSECRTCVDNEEHDEHFRIKSWQHAKCVSMIGSEKRHLPTSKNYGSLETLLLQKNLNLAEIPPTYFESMCNLLVLNLHGTNISRVPSLEGLCRLKAFYLNGCSGLMIVPSQIFQPLERLAVFDIRGTGVNFVPCLKTLQCLRISYIVGGDYDGISELDKLEELTIEVKSLEQWCNDAENIIQKVASLKNLTTFRCSFPSSETLGKFLKTCKSWRGEKQFSSFQFFVGCENSKHPKVIEPFEDRISKYVKYEKGDKKDDSAITEMLSQAEAFELICHNNVRNLSELITISQQCSLRGLLIESCDQMSAFVVGDMACNAINNTLPEKASPFLPKLELLYLDNLKNLRCVLKGRFHAESFSMLLTLTLKNCPVLTRIFSEETVKNFPKLQELVVQDCSAIEVLIKLEKDTKIEQDTLPELKVLTLDNLLNFRSICSNENLTWSSLEQLNVQECPQLKVLPLNKTNAATLRIIRGEKEWWNNLNWTAREVQERFESAFLPST